MLINEIFCQERVITSLQQAYAAGRMHHAYLFCGDDGVGKRTLATAWAKMLLCENQQKMSGKSDFSDSCGKCHSCVMFESSSHPDFHLITKELVKFTKDGKSKTTPVDMPVDVIREFLIEKVSNRPTAGKYSIYVLEEFEKVNPFSQNAMLKVLEEPPGYCVIILLCSRLEKMLPTILSRCQLLRFGPIAEDRIVERLVSEGIAETEATYWSRFAQGRLGVALDWVQLEIKDNRVYDLKCELIEKIAGLALADAVDTAEWMGKVSKKIASGWSSRAKELSTTDVNRRTQKGLIGMVGSLYGDAMKVGLGQREELVNTDQIKLVERVAGGIEPESAAESVQMCHRIHTWVDASVNEKLIFEQLLLNLTNSDIVYGL